MKKWNLLVATALAATALTGVTSSARAADVSSQRLATADKNPADWLTYHGSYKSWHYSGLDQINASNVKNLKVAWSHATPKSTRGVQSFPLAADGIVYYSGAYNQVFALDGAPSNCAQSALPDHWPQVFGLVLLPMLQWRHKKAERRPL